MSCFLKLIQGLQNFSLANSWNLFYSQNKHLGDFQWSTNVDTIVGSNPNGICSELGSLHSLSNFTVQSWQGENRLGEGLMKVRQSLK